MNNPLCRTWIKVLGSVLFFVFIACGITAAIFAIDGYENDVANFNTLEEFEQDLIAQREENWVNNDITRILDEFESSNGNIQSTMVYNQFEQLGAYFTISVDGNNLGGTYTDQDYLTHHAKTFDMFLNAYPVGTTLEFDIDLIHPDQREMLKIEPSDIDAPFGYVSASGILYYYYPSQTLMGTNGETLVANNSGYLEVTQSSAAYSEVQVDVYYPDGAIDISYFDGSMEMLMLRTEFIYQDWFIPIAIVSGFISLVLFIYLIWASGRKYGQDSIHQNAFDKTPLEIWLFIVLICASVVPSGDIGGLLALVLCAIFTIFTFFSICTRIKAGRLLRCTITYMVLSFLHRSTGYIWKSLKSGAMKTPLALRCSLLVLGMMLFFLMFFWAAGQWESGVMLFLGLFFLALLGGLVVLMSIWMGQLTTQAKAIANGDINHKIDTSNMRFDFAELGNTLGSLGQSINLATEQRMKSERMKTQLITNVSHDIKTPLTSIINYVDLLSKEDCDNPTVSEYCEILGRQSQKLKHLLEDLVEASRVSSGNVDVSLILTDLLVLSSQLQGEYQEKLQENELELIVNQPDHPCHVMADSRHIQRVFDNLMDNVIKYALPGTRVYLDVRQTENKNLIILKNTSKQQLNITASELMERFVRGDGARNSEGNGLGLSIAQSLVRIQSAEISLTVDGDLFKAEVSFDRM